jgi:D-alanyl-D-alanine endopeptidase (penicillin-binding protein 7)
MALLPRVLVFATNLVLLAAVAHVGLDVNDTAAEQPRAEAELGEVAEAVVARGPAPWSPPDWFPAESADDLALLAHFDAAPVHEDGPKLRAGSAIIADLDRGEILWAKNADEARPIASVTKVIAALTLASTRPDLDRETCVDHTMWPHRPGARSRFETGACHDGWSYLGAALVASDNRAALGMAAVAGLEPADFVRRMWTVSEQLGLGDSSWADPSGLDDANLSTARDVLRAIVATAAHPTLRIAASAPTWELDRSRGKTLLPTTNRLHARWEVLAAKTGFTDTAGWCFAQVVRTATGRRLATVVLGAPNHQARFDDTVRLVRWAEGDAVDAFPAPKSAKKSSAKSKKSSASKGKSKAKAKAKSRR